MKNVMVPTDSLPEVRDTVLQAAGLDDTRLAALLQTAIDVAVNKLSATKVSRTTYKGDVVSVHEDDDHTVQLKAAELIMKFSVEVAGLKRSSDEGKGGSGPISISINMPASPEKDVTP